MSSDETQLAANRAAHLLLACILAMRVFKIILLLVVLLADSFYIYFGVIYPATWRSETKRESIRILQAAHSTTELTNAVGYLGWFVQLTNQQWVAIRYRDTHSGVVCSSAIARDSGGKWLESERHFCGRFQFWPHLKEKVQAEDEQRKLTPNWFTNRVPLADQDGGYFPSYRELMAIESASDLESARNALEKIGFRKFNP